MTAKIETTELETTPELDEYMMRASTALRLDARLERWLKGGNGSRMSHASFSRDDNEWVYTLSSGDHETVTIRNSDRLLALAHALGVALLVAS